MIDKSLWVLDLGNTLIKVCLFDQQGDLLHCRSLDELSPTVFETLFEVAPEAQRWICSVRELPQVLKDALVQDSRFRCLDKSNPLPIDISSYAREELGNDRLSGVVAASKEHTDVLLISLGSCITYDYLINAVYAGGAISPGLQMRLKALHHFTHLLPNLHLSDIPSELGHNTREAILSGTLGGAMDEIRARSNDFLEQHASAKVILSGGDATWVSPYLKCPHRIIDNMVARGTAIIARFGMETI